ncbi:hypothetical protein K469DRAFT_97158 [Zopfia rhizophila CBS 207.26]|uniref:Uncharacterized protein n=1 Tax=Zopfia rhizophila CBS 207.26 TaxID=1314779 RepID=A0A6A6D9G2_9PEZI|nr:hypothetical protein K469DRAFT_97158 [Zopfia rhizophila CBS 207.26]
MRNHHAQHNGSLAADEGRRRTRFVPTHEEREVLRLKAVPNRIQLPRHNLSSPQSPPHSTFLAMSSRGRMAARRRRREVASCVDEDSRTLPASARARGPIRPRTRQIVLNPTAHKGHTSWQVADAVWTRRRDALATDRPVTARRCRSLMPVILFQYLVVFSFRQCAAAGALPHASTPASSLLLRFGSGKSHFSCRSTDFENPFFAGLVLRLFGYLT